LCIIVAVAAVLRFVFSPGMVASDDLTYVSRALEIASGIWSSSDYIGAIRYGVNIPIGASIALFGPGLLAGFLIPLLCSLCEIGTVAIIARPAWGERAALYAATLLCFTPLHIEHATIIHADPILAFAITLTFAFFWRAENSNNPWLYFAAGVSAGFAYWTKEASVLFLMTFLVYAVAERRWRWPWAYAGAGALLLFVLNSALMWALSGDPLHIVRVTRSMVNNGWTDKRVADAPLFYFRYLFFDVRHTWFAAYLALAAGLLLLRRRVVAAEQRQFGAYVTIWLLGLLAAFSFIPVSIAPLRFVMKQSNYMTIFLAPLAILGAFGLSRVGRWMRTGVMTAFVAGGVGLTALAQQDMRAFVANGQAAEVFAEAHRNDMVYGTAWVSRISAFHALLRGLKAEPHVRDLRFLRSSPEISPGLSFIIVIDRETFGRSEVDVDLRDIPSCWVRTGQLAPIGYGAGAVVTNAIVSVVRMLPGPLGERISQPFERLLRPAPAEVYAAPPADPWCGTSPPEAQKS
jgi:4-amino-4-deoxy-L-arabinose transferase-like glycosyltransferase